MTEYRYTKCAKCAKSTTHGDDEYVFFFDRRQAFGKAGGGVSVGDDKAARRGGQEHLYDNARLAARL